MSSDHIDDPGRLGQRLREVRLAAGLRQADLSFPGCSIGYISRIEAGMRVPSLQVVRRLAESLGVSERWLAIGVEDVPEHNAFTRLRDASIALRLDNVDEAEALFEAIADGETDTIVLAHIQAGLGQIAFRRGEAHEAIARLEQAFGLQPALDDPAAADTLGRSYARIGENVAAVALFRRWIERADADGDPALRLRFVVLLANALIDAGAHGEAEEVLSRLLADAESADPVTLARVYWSRSRLHAMQNDHAAASRDARRALDLLELTEQKYFRAQAHALLAFSELGAGNAAEALELINRGRLLLGSDATPHDLAGFDLEEARALGLLGRPEEACALAMRAIATMGPEGHPGDAARCFAEIASAFDAIGDPARAIEVYELAIEYLDKSPTPLFPEILAQFGELLERQGRPEEAFAVYKRAARRGSSATRAVTADPAE